MAETKGITIDFYGNTVEFDRSLDGINKALKSVKNELSTLNKQIKFDPSNVEKLEAKFNKLKELQKLLNEQVEMYKKRLAEMDSSDVGSAEWQKITKELQKAETELLKVNQELLKMPTSNIQVLANKLEEAEKKLNTIGGAIENVGKKMSVLSTATVGLFTAGVKYNSTLEQQTALFRTLTGSAEEADRILSSIRESASKSPFDVQSLITANQYLISAGVEADESQSVIMDLANAISATGGGNAELARMAQNLQQISNNGKASTIDIRQFGNAGINLFSLLQESTGHTIDELQDMDITFDMIADALKKAGQEGGRYAGAMEAQSQTLAGMINKLKASIGELLGELSEALMPIIKEVVSRVQEWTEKIKNLDDNQKNLITRIGLIVAGLGPFLTIVGKLIGSSGIGGLTGSISKFLKSEGFTKWVATITTSLGSTGGGLGGVLKALGSAFSGLLNPITLVVGALVTAYATNENFRNTVNGLVVNLVNSLKPAFQNIATVVKNVIEVLKTIATTIGNVLSPVLNALAPLLNKIISIFSSLINLVSSVATLFSQVLVVAIKAVSTVIQTLINWVTNLFNKLSNTTWGNNFKTIINDISNALKTVVGWVQSAVDWFQKLINKGNEASSTASTASSNAERYAQNAYARRSVVFESGGLGLASGGIGLTANIHVNNNGTPIDEQEISRWVNIMTDKLDDALGRRM